MVLWKEYRWIKLDLSMHFSINTCHWFGQLQRC